MILRLTRYEKSFRHRVIDYLKSKDYKAYEINNMRCLFDILSIAPSCSITGIRCKSEQLKLLHLNISIFIVSKHYNYEIEIKRLQ